MRTGLRYLLATGLVIVSCASYLALTLGFGNTVAAQGVSQSYIADNGTQAGMIVQLDEKDKSRVKPATQSKLQAIYGVVILPNDAPLSLSEATNERRVFVATSGTYKMLVSDQNGPIGKDDYIAVSSIDGVGMQADPVPSIVAGKALTGFDGRSGVKSQTKTTDSKGAERTIKFGYVTVIIDVTRNPLTQPEKPPSLPGFLQNAANGIADKPVSTVKVYLSVVIILISTVIVIVILVTGIRSSVTALGRNPLARKSIIRNLSQVVLIGLMILIVGLFGVYLLLKL